MVATFSSEGGAFTKLTKYRQNNEKRAELNNEAALHEINDLIKLNESSAITEELVIKVLQSRFTHRNFFVSFYNCFFKFITF